MVPPDFRIQSLRICTTFEISPFMVCYAGDQGRFPVPRMGDNARIIVPLKGDKSAYSGTATSLRVLAHASSRAVAGRRFWGMMGGWSLTRLASPRLLRGS